MCLIEKSKLIFMDTNILSEIGRNSEEYIKTIIKQIIIDLHLIVVITPFNIHEIEKMPDVILKKRIHEFINQLIIVFLKPMDVIFMEESNSYNDHHIINPILFSTSLIARGRTDGEPANYLAILENLRANNDYLISEDDHVKINKRSQEKLGQKLNCSLEDFVLFHAKNSTYFGSRNTELNLAELGLYCPSFVAYSCALYSKIGSKGLRKNYGEMNDVAMSYIYPYVGSIITEKRQANYFEMIKERGVVPALKETQFKKYSDVFKMESGVLKFSLKTTT